MWVSTKHLGDLALMKKQSQEIYIITNKKLKQMNKLEWTILKKSKRVLNKNQNQFQYLKEIIFKYDTHPSLKFVISKSKLFLPIIIPNKLF